MPIVKNQDDLVIKISHDRENKTIKKEKPCKTFNKREKEEYESAFVDLDIKIINQISSLKLLPPVDKSQLSNFIYDLEKKLQEFMKKSEEEKLKQKVKKI